MRNCLGAVSLLFTLCAVLLSCLLIADADAAQQAKPLYPFSAPQQRTRFQALLKELRCLVCQNENLADSNAALAQELRAEVYQKVKAGDSDKSIKAYLVARYGDFVLFKPPVNRETYALWFGPFIVLFVAFALLFLWVYRQKSLRSKKTKQ